MVYLFLLLLLLGVPFLIGAILSAPVYRGPASDHFDGKRFINPAGKKAKGFPDVIKWMRERKPGKWSRQMGIPPGEKPLARVDTGTRITFINHSSFLIQTDGLNIITDPVYSDRVSPFNFAGPQRMRPPGIRFEDLPQIDVVLLSHNHYDHLDITTVKKISRQHHPQFIVPLGVAAYLKRHGITNITEMDWWEETEIRSSMKLQAVPAQHFSGRGLLDRDMTLWCGYVLYRTGGNIYFAGDTGYNEITFHEIGTRCKPALSIIPIGAFKPEWFMSPIHCSPTEAVQIHLDLKTPQTIASHFGTFPLADDGFEDPATDLALALKRANVPTEKFLVPKEGQALEFN